MKRKLFWRYKALWQRAARIGDWKYLKILDNTFLFNVVDDPLERANLKERRKDIYDRLIGEWNAWNATTQVPNGTPTAEGAQWHAQRMSHIEHAMRSGALTPLEHAHARAMHGTSQRYLDAYHAGRQAGGEQPAAAGFGSLGSGSVGASVARSSPRSNIPSGSAIGTTKSPYEQD